MVVATAGDAPAAALQCLPGERDPLPLVGAHKAYYAGVALSLLRPRSSGSMLALPRYKLS